MPLRQHTGSTTRFGARLLKTQHDYDCVDTLSVSHNSSIKRPRRQLSPLNLLERSPVALLRRDSEKRKVDHIANRRRDGYPLNLPEDELHPDPASHGSRVFRNLHFEKEEPAEMTIIHSSSEAREQSRVALGLEEESARGEVVAPRSDESRDTSYCDSASEVFSWRRSRRQQALSENLPVVSVHQDGLLETPDLPPGLRYPLRGPGSVRIGHQEWSRLAPNCFLNDSLIEFGIRYGISTVFTTSVLLTSVLQALA